MWWIGYRADDIDGCGGYAGDVVVHIFLPKEREFYNLEEFYGNATLVPLPFENRSVQ